MSSFWLSLQDFVHLMVENFDVECKWNPERMTGGFHSKFSDSRVTKAICHPSSVGRRRESRRVSNDTWILGNSLTPYLASKFLSLFGSSNGVILLFPSTTTCRFPTFCRWIEYQHCHVVGSWKSNHY